MGPTVGFGSGMVASFPFRNRVVIVGKREQDIGNVTTEACREKAILGYTKCRDERYRYRYNDAVTLKTYAEPVRHTPKGEKAVWSKRSKR